MDDNDLKIVQGLKPHLGDSPFVFDIGANRGNYTDFVLSLFPDAKMILVEPNDMWGPELSRKYSGNKNITILSLLVGSKKQDATFYYFTNHNDQISSIYRRPVFLGLPMKESVRPMTTIDAIMEFFSLSEIDFIKVDTEGAEFDVLKGSVKALTNKKVKFIQIEYGGTYPDAGITMMEVIAFVNGFGYHVYSYNGTFVELDQKTFIEDFHYDNYLISKISL